MIPVTTCRMVAETATRQVPVCEAVQVPVTLTTAASPASSPGRSSVQQCTMVPVAVPACLTCQQ